MGPLRGKGGGTVRNRCPPPYGEAHVTRAAMAAPVYRSRACVTKRHGELSKWVRQVRRAAHAYGEERVCRRVVPR